MSARFALLSFVTCAVLVHAQVAHARPAEVLQSGDAVAQGQTARGEATAYSQALGTLHDMLMGVSFQDLLSERFTILPRWDITPLGMHWPTEPPTCWYNPFSPIVFTKYLTCHRPDETLTITESYSATIKFSVTGDDSLEINWKGFKAALRRQEGQEIGASIELEIEDVYTPFDCWSGRVLVYPAYVCYKYEVTWHWLGRHKTATVYLWRPAMGHCEVWTDLEFEPGCEGCTDPYPLGPNAHWFCAGEDEENPVWATWCEEECTGDPESVTCESFQPDVLTGLILRSERK